MASEIGLYACDEANIETHGFTQSPTFSLLATMPAWRSMFLQRVQNMARRTVSFPCVVLHSLGNESGRGQTLTNAARGFGATTDPGRAVRYGARGDPPVPGDVKRLRARRT